MSDVCGDFTYEDVYLRSWDLAKGILGILGQVRDKVHHHNKKEPQQENHLQGGSGQRVAFLCPPGVTHVLATWACWLSGQVHAFRHYFVTLFLFDFQWFLITIIFSLVITIIIIFFLCQCGSASMPLLITISLSSSLSSYHHHYLPIFTRRLSLYAPPDNYLLIFQVAVPLCPSSPLQRLHHQVADSTCSLVITTR